MINNKNLQISVIYHPDYEEEEKQIFEKAFGKGTVSFQKYIVKGMSAGAFDVQFIIQLIADPAIRQLMVGTILLLVKELFDRNRKLTKEKRPRYTILVLKKKMSHIVISNVNTENQLTITYSRMTNMKTIVKDYTAEELKKLLEEND